MAQASNHIRFDSDGLSHIFQIKADWYNSSAQYGESPVIGSRANGFLNSFISYPKSFGKILTYQVSEQVS